MVPTILYREWIAIKKKKIIGRADNTLISYYGDKCQKVASTAFSNPLPLNENKINFTKEKRIRSIQIESIWRRHDKRDSEIEKNVISRLKNIVGKVENVIFPHFLLFLQCFQKPAFMGFENTR